MAYSEHLTAAGIKPSTGAVASSYDNALAESVIGLYKTELIKRRGPWKGFDDLELATAEWVEWFNHRRPFEYCDDLTPLTPGRFTVLARFGATSGRQHLRCGELTRRVRSSD